MEDSAIAGACAGIASAGLTCPLDVVKTLKQATSSSSHSPPQPSSTAKAPILAHYYPRRTIRSIVQQIWAQEGVRGFYHGLGPTIFGYLPTWACYFTVYDVAKQKLVKSDLGIDMQVGGHILSAVLAGTCTTIVTSPVWVVKTRYMLQAIPQPGEVPYRSTLDAFVRLYKAEGIRVFYKGLVPSLFGVSHVSIQFPLYDNCKRVLHRYRRHLPEQALSPSDILACSTTSKMVASCLTYPHEVVRTQLIRINENDSRDRPHGASRPSLSPRKGLISIIKSTWKHDGIRGFYKGMTINLCRTVPNSAVTLLTYELIMQKLQALHGRQPKDT